MKECFNCNQGGTEFYGHIICESCKSKLRLFTDETILKYHNQDPEGFSNDIINRLDVLETDYIKKKIKLLHIQDQIRKV